MLARSLTVAVGLAAGAQALGSGVTFAPVLATGQQAPGMDPGVTISHVDSSPNIGDGGHIATAFVRLAGPGITASNDLVGYTGLPGSLSVYQRGGAGAGPLGPGITFANQASGVQWGGFKGMPNVAGSFAFAQFIQGSGVDSTNDSAVFLYQGGTTSVLFREGTLLPAFTNGGVAREFRIRDEELVRIMDDGSMVALVEFASSLDNGGLLVGTPAAPAVGLEWGVPPPGCPEPLDMIDGYADAPNRVSDTGKFIVKGRLGGAPTTSDDAFWVGDASSVSLWLREGGSLPGLDPLNIVVVGDDWQHSINDNGEALVALRLQTGVGDTVSNNDRLLVFGTPGSLSVVARENGQVPGLPVGVLYNAFDFDGVYNGGIVIAARLRGAVTSTNDAAILVGPAASPSVLMREGDPAPGFPTGYTLDSLSIPGAALKMNKSGRFAVGPVSVKDPMGVSIKVMYACAPGLPPQLVCAWDQLLEVAPGDLRTVARNNSSIERPGGMNNQDQFTTVLDFTDGTSAVVVGAVSFDVGPAFVSGGAPVVLDTTGTGDGVLDPGESLVGLTLPIRNNGTGGATAVTATLQSFTPTVTVQSTSAAYPDIAPGAAASNGAPFVVTVSPSHPCGANAILRLTVTSAEGSNTVNLLIPTGSNYPGCAVFSAGTVAVSDSSANGNGNNIADPGESAIALTIPVTKSGGAGTSTGVSATLATSTPTATIVSGASVYPDIAAGGTQSNSTPFVIALDASHPCGEPIVLTLSITADGGLGAGLLIPALRAGSLPVPTTITRTAIDVVIPDAPADPMGLGVNADFTVSGVNGPIGDVDFRFDGTSTSTSSTIATTGLGHGNLGDLVIKLTSPDPDGAGPLTGTTVVLANRPGPESTANNLRQCTFDDGAASSIQIIGNATGPITGKFLPVQPLSAFNGLSGAAANGVWVLNVTDVFLSAATTTAWVRNASIIVTNAPVCTPSECVADFNNSGSVQVQDIFDFLSAWFNGCTGQPGAPCNGASADINGGGLAVQDIFDFLNAWFAGCP